MKYLMPTYKNCYLDRNVTIRSVSFRIRQLIPPQLRNASHGLNAPEIVDHYRRLCGKPDFCIQMQKTDRYILSLLKKSLN